MAERTDAAMGAPPERVGLPIGASKASTASRRLFLDPGDIVLAEGPTYVAARRVPGGSAEVVPSPWMPTPDPPR